LTPQATRASVSLTTREINEFQRHLGKAIAAWARIESMFCTYFQNLTGMQRVAARSVFFSARSFNGRSDMLKALIHVVDIKPTEYESFLKAAIKKANQFVSTRNQIAHGESLCVDNPDSPYHRQHIILDGSEPLLELSTTVITQDGLINAADNFLQLAYALLVCVDWKWNESGKITCKISSANCCTTQGGSFCQIRPDVFSTV
jgi:hypothetical protein